MKITKQLFGYTKDNLPVTQFRVENTNGSYMIVLDYGCIIQALFVPNKDEALTDVCLGYDTVAAYEENEGYLGAVIGRYGNRIGEGKLMLNGTCYQLACNDAPNHLHGGVRGFDKYIWAHEIIENALCFSRTSVDGEEGYPGTLNIKVSYSFTDDNELCIEYDAVGDADTVLNMTNHSYFNLNGEGGGSILRHKLKINAAGFAENDAHCLPTGKTLAVENTPFDFRKLKEIGTEIEVADIQLKNGKGYDNNYVLDEPAKMNTAAELCADESGICMTVYTTKPCIQLYTGNVLAGAIGKSGKSYTARTGLCLETQYYPNAIACGIEPSALLKKGEAYCHKTIYAFTTIK